MENSRFYLKDGEMAFLIRQSRQPVAASFGGGNTWLDRKAESFNEHFELVMNKRVKEYRIPGPFKEIVAYMITLADEGDERAFSLITDLTRNINKELEK